MTDHEQSPTFHVPEEVRIVAQCIDRYEELVTVGSFPDIDQILEPVDSEHRLAVLFEIVLIDMEYHWKWQQGTTTHEYLARYPELKTRGESEQDLLLAERELRRRHEETFDAAAFSVRHPDIPFDDDPALARTEAIHKGPHTSTVRETNPPVPESIKRFKIESQLGQGSFGVVYLAHDPELDRKVAIKVAHNTGRSELMTKLLKEGAKAMARLDHENIVHVYEASQTADGRPFIVYQYINGRSLDKRIAAGDFSIEQAVRWVIALARGLHVAHKQGLVHRDVKPANILVDISGTPLLTDFDLARRDDRFCVNDRDVRIGTLEYMAPEQAEGRAHLVTAASDVYSLGAVLYQLLTRRPPFRDRGNELLEQVKFSAPRPPSTINENVPKAVEEVCMKALAKGWENRPATAKAMADALERALKPPINWSRRFLVAVAGLAIVATAVGLGGFFMRSGDSPEPTTSPPGIKPIEINVSTDESSAYDLLKDHPVLGGTSYSVLVETEPECYTHILRFMSSDSEPLVRDGPKSSEHSLFDNREDQKPLPRSKCAILIVAIASNTPFGEAFQRNIPSPEFLKEIVDNIPNALHKSRVDEVAFLAPAFEPKRGGKRFVIPQNYRNKLDTFCKKHNCTYRAALFSTIP